MAAICGPRRRLCYMQPSVFLTLLFFSVTPSCNNPSSGPPPAFSIAQVKDLGTIRTNPSILGRDGAYSALFQGYSVWMYGSTFLTKPNADDRTLLSNSWSYTTDLNAHDGISGFQERLDSAGAPKMILPETPEEREFNHAHLVNKCQAKPCGAQWALWPQSIVVNPVNNSALIFYMVVSTLPGDFNFQGIGTSVAVWQDFQKEPQRPAFHQPLVASHPDLMFRENQPNFGSAALVRDGMLYVYGCGIPTNGLDKGCRLGKVSLSNPQDRSAWTFYSGNGSWSSQVSDAVSVFTGDDILSVSWNDYLQQYVAVYSQILSQNVMLRTAVNPEGPWSGELLAFVAMPPSTGNVHDAHAHAEYDENNGQTIFVSYSRAMPATFSSEVRLVSLTLQRTVAGAR
jgi:hypothetical protein